MVIKKKLKVEGYVEGDFIFYYCILVIDFFWVVNFVDFFFKVSEIMVDDEELV